MKKNWMIKNLPLIVFLGLGCLVVGCGTAAPAKKTTVPKTEKNTWPEIEIPKEITADNVMSLETLLFSLNEKHQQRRELRDALIRYHLNLFNSLAEADDEGRLAQFKVVLALHDPFDFRTGNVSPDAAPLADWIVNNYEPQGKEALVLAGLAYLSMARPDTMEYAQRFGALLNWSEKVRETIKEPVERFSSISGLYVDATSMVPNHELLERLAVALAKRQQAVVQFLQMVAGDQGRFSPLIFHSVISRGGIGKEFVRAWFMGDYLDEVLDKMKELNVLDGIEEDLLAVLAQLKAGQNVPYNYHRLAAQVLGPGDPVAGMRACMKALQLAPGEPRYNMCAGRFLSNMDRQLAAIEYFARAVSLDNGDGLVQAMELVQDSLYRLHMEEKRHEMDVALTRTAEIVQMVIDKDVDDDEVAFAASSLIETAAIIQYDDGKIEQAESGFTMASTLWPGRPTPITRLAEIYYWRGEYKKAVDFLTQAMNAKEKIGGSYADYWRAMLYEQRGDNYSAMGNTEAALADYRLALNRWETADYPMEQSPVIEIRRGVLLSRLGEQEKSMEKFRESIRLSPDRRASFAEIISFLVATERLTDAQEFYELAFNQDMLAGMWKVYFSIWVDGLSQLKEGKHFDLAVGYLQNTPSDSWQDKLAAFFIGTVDATTLRKETRNKGQQVEADYYEGLLRLISGDNKTAGILLQKVIDSQLYAFFEYRMASELLKKQHAKVEPSVQNDVPSAD